MHHMQSRPHPHGDLVAAQVRWQIGLRHQRPICQMSGKARRGIAQQLLAHLAPHAIGTDQGTGLHAGAFGSADFQNISSVPPALHCLAQPNVHPSALSRPVQQALQIGAVDGGVRRAIQSLSTFAQGQGAQHLPGLGIARLQLLRKSGHLRQRVAQPPGLQDARQVRPNLDARAHLAELRCALKQLHRHAVLRTRDSSGQAANAAACNQHLLACHVCHAWIVRESQALNLSDFFQA